MVRTYKFCIQLSHRLLTQKAMQASLYSICLLVATWVNSGKRPIFSFFFLSLSFCFSPWYNRTCWLGVKHQVTYLLTRFTSIKKYLKKKGIPFPWDNNKKYMPTAITVLMRQTGVTSLPNRTWRVMWSQSAFFPQTRPESIVKSLRVSLLESHWVLKTPFKGL